MSIADLGAANEVKIFDPNDPVTGSYAAELVDAAIIERCGQWWLFLAGQPPGHGATDIYSASLPSNEPLSAAGWTPTRNADGVLLPVATNKLSHPWDGRGGRHCPSYVRGWDPRKGRWVERIYYAGAVDNLWGPYSIGFLEWDGETWADQSTPAFVPNEAWEHGSVYEPNVIHHEGKWKMWYVAGSNHEDYLVQGYAESDDGATDWRKHVVFAPPEMKMFDFCVRERDGIFHAIFSRVWVGQGEPPPETGFWWCSADKPSNNLSDWSRPIQIMTADDRGWHAGPWKPSFAFGEQGDVLVFFNGMYRTSDPGPFPFAFTLGCREIELPAGC